MLFVTDLIGQYLSHQVQTGTMFSAAFSNILISNIVTFFCLHLLAPIATKFINNGFLIEEKIILSREDENLQKITHEQNTNLFFSLKQISLRVTLLLFAFVSMYSIFRLVEWLLPSLNAISTIGLITVTIMVLGQYWTTETELIN